MTDENPAIATLLNEAARLAGAANGKIDEALAVAARDEAFNEDQRFFKRNPDRSYRARLATQQEVEDLHTSKAWPEGWTIDPECFVWALVRGSLTKIETTYFVLPVPKREPREDELKRMWGLADALLGVEWEAGNNKQCK